MKIFILTDKLENKKHEFRTLQEVADFLDVKYHQARTLLQLDKKVFLHKN